MRERQAPWTASGASLWSAEGNCLNCVQNSGGQVPLVEGEPSVGYGWLKGFDAVFFVLVLFVIHDSVLKAVALFHRTECVVGRHLDGAVFVGALFANEVGFRIRRRQDCLGALG